MSTKSKKAPDKKWWNNILLLTIGIAAVSVIILVIIINSILGVTSRHGKEFNLPDFSNMTMAEAQQVAKQHSLKLEITDSVYVKSLKKGVITRQSPRPESMVKRGRRVLLTTNAIAPKRVSMPLLVGYSLRQAKTELTSAGLQLGKLIYIDDIATNNVLAQRYNGTDITPGTSIDGDSIIDLVLGLNPEDNSTFIPDLMGYKFYTAKDIIQGNSLNAAKALFDKEILNYSDSLEAFVYRQIPEPSDSVKYTLGTDITIFLTKDPEKLRKKEEQQEQNDI